MTVLASKNGRLDLDIRSNNTSTPSVEMINFRAPLRNDLIDLGVMCIHNPYYLILTWTSKCLQAHNHHRGILAIILRCAWIPLVVVLDPLELYPICFYIISHLKKRLVIMSFATNHSHACQHVTQTYCYVGFLPNNHLSHSVSHGKSHTHTSKW